MNNLSSQNVTVDKQNEEVTKNTIRHLIIEKIAESQDETTLRRIYLFANSITG